MFYEPDKNDHGLRYNPFKSICVPRAIAWVSSLSRDGVPNYRRMSASSICCWRAASEG